MAGKVLMVSPEAPAEEGEKSTTARRMLTGGIRLGVLDNSKGNADHLLKFIVDGLREALPIKSVVSLRKLSVSIPAPAEIMDQLTREADLVVSAMGD
jgi:hypothetical protein